MLDQESADNAVPIVETTISKGMPRYRIDMAKVNRISELTKRSAYSKNKMVMRNSCASIKQSGIG